VLDSSGFDRHGTLFFASRGGGTRDLPPIDDDRGAAFFGSNPVFTASVPRVPAFDLNSRFTVAFWARLFDAGDVHFIGMRAPHCGTIGWEIGQDSVHGLYFAARPNQIVTAPPIPVGEWTHIIATFAHSAPVDELVLYVNGARAGAGPLTSDFNTVRTDLTFGHAAGCPGVGVAMDDIQIRSINVDASEAAELGMVPLPPTNLVVTSTTSVSINLAWDPVPRARRYLLSSGLPSGGEQLLTHTPANPATFEDDHLDPGETRFYTVRSVVGRLFSTESNEAFATTDAPPDAPAGVTATVIAPDRIEVNWSPVARAAKYVVFRSTNEGPFTLAGSTTGTTFLAINLAPATTYAFQVRAVDAVQTQGAVSDAASATTP
jgi:hypothetical protein